MKSLRQSFILLGMLMLFTLLLSPALAQEATPEPTDEATPAPTEEPTAAPTAEPTEEPEPTPEPTEEPGTPIMIDGAVPVQSLVNALVESFQAQAEGDFEFVEETSGPNAAFERLCASEIDMVMSTRFISEDEIAACDAADVEFVENLLAYEGLVFLM